MMTKHQNIAQWHGKQLVDWDGERIGKLEDVYVDVETDEPMFGTVKEGLIGRHLTFVPLAALTFGRYDLQMAVTREQVKSAPNIDLHGDELSRADESALYHHYELHYTPPATHRGPPPRRARRTSPPPRPPPSGAARPPPARTPPPRKPSPLRHQRHPASSSQPPAGAERTAA